VLKFIRDKDHASRQESALSLRSSSASRKSVTFEEERKDSFILTQDEMSSTLRSALKPLSPEASAF